MSRFAKRPFFITLGLTLVLFVPVFEVSRLLDWNPTIAGWWSLVVIGISLVAWDALADREE